MKKQSADAKYRKLLARRVKVMRDIERKKEELELNRSRYYDSY